MKYKNEMNKLVKTKYGLMLCNKFDKYVGQALITYGEYSDEEVSLFKGLCTQGDTVIEVGANYGSHTLPLSQIVGESGTVIAFEPQRVVFQTLCANMALNSVQNVHCFQNAVSSKKTELYIPAIDYDKEGNFGGISMQKEGTEEVKVVKLDSFISIKSLSLIKIDVEGMELNVLKGARKTIQKFQPILYVENDRFDKHTSLIQYIDSLGYEMYWHITPLFNTHNFFKKNQNIYKKLVSCNMLCFPKSLKMDLQNFDKVNIHSKHPFDV